MKILYDYETMIIQKIGGVSRYHYELAKRMTEITTVRIPVLYSRNYYFQSIIKGKTYSYQNRYLQFFLRKINALFTFTILTIAYLKGTPYDIVHSTFYNPDYLYPYYHFIDKKHRTKYIITIYDMIQEMESNTRANMRRSATAKKKALSIADGVISISENTKKDLIKYYAFLQPDNIRTIYLSCEMSQNSGNISPKGIPEKYILFVGQRVERKNFHRVLEAFSELKDTFPNLYLVCTGGGKFNENELKSIESYGLNDRVTRKFFEDNELYSLYANAKCFIFPSLYEGFGLPILEAWSRNCPVLLSTASCFPEIAGDAALYFNGENVGEIKNALIKILNDSSLCDELRMKGRERLKLFSWDKMADETYEFYTNIINNKT